MTNSPSIPSSDIVLLWKIYQFSLPLAASLQFIILLEFESRRGYKQKAGNDEALRQLWEVFDQIFKKRGRDIKGFLDGWTQKQSDKLSSPGARADFEELSAEGCVPQVLAVLLALLRWSPHLEQFWKRFYGSSKERRKTRQALLKSAGAHQQLLRLPISLEDVEIAAEFAKMGHL